MRSQRISEIFPKVKARYSSVLRKISPLPRSLSLLQRKTHRSPPPTPAAHGCGPTRLRRGTRTRAHARARGEPVHPLSASARASPFKTTRCAHTQRIAAAVSASLSVSFSFLFFHAPRAPCQRKRERALPGGGQLLPSQYPFERRTSSSLSAVAQ